MQQRTHNTDDTPGNSTLTEAFSHLTYNPEAMITKTIIDNELTSPVAQWLYKSVRRAINNKSSKNVPILLRARAAALANPEVVFPACPEDYALIHAIVNTESGLISIRLAIGKFLFNRVFDLLYSAQLRIAEQPETRPDKDQSFLLAIMIPVSILSTLLFFTVIGGYYAAKKVGKSCANIYRGEKILRSLARLAGTSAGGCAGVLLGIFLGSLVPGVGTLCGAIVGGVIFGCALAGLGALLTKYTARIISWAGVKFGAYGDALEISNPTNPDKYRLTQTQLKKLAHMAALDDFSQARIHEMLEDIKWNKKRINTFFDAAGQAEKKEWNQLIRNIKTNRATSLYGMCLNQRAGSLFLWSSTGSWQRHKIENTTPLMTLRPVI